MKVHVTLDAGLAADARARRSALGRVLRAGRMRLASRKRFERYLIVSGAAPTARLAALRAVPAVVAVEPDQEDGAERV